MNTLSLIDIKKEKLENSLKDDWIKLTFKYQTSDGKFWYPHFYADAMGGEFWWDRINQIRRWQEEDIKAERKFKYQKANGCSA